MWVRRQPACSKYVAFSQFSFTESPRGPAAATGPNFLFAAVLFSLWLQISAVRHNYTTQCHTMGPVMLMKWDHPRPPLPSPLLHNPVGFQRSFGFFDVNAAIACNLSLPSNLFLVCVRLIHKSTTTERVRKESLALMSLTIHCYADDSRMSATHALVPRGKKNS